MEQESIYLKWLEAEKDETGMFAYDISKEDSK